jgi:hypothetical protein
MQSNEEFYDQKAKAEAGRKPGGAPLNHSQKSRKL